MNVQDIENRIHRIEVNRKDCEVSHSLEDELYNDFVVFVAEHSTDIYCKTLAMELLKVRKIDFPRWCA